MTFHLAARRHLISFWSLRTMGTSPRNVRSHAHPILLKDFGAIYAARFNDTRKKNEKLHGTDASQKMVRSIDVIAYTDRSKVSYLGVIDSIVCIKSSPKSVRADLRMPPIRILPRPRDG